MSLYDLKSLYSIFTAFNILNTKKETKQNQSQVQTE